VSATAPGIRVRPLWRPPSRPAVALALAAALAAAGCTRSTPAVAAPVPRLEATASGVGWSGETLEPGARCA
jgi:hypothetical protein